MTAATLMTGSVTLHIDAPPEKVWALVSDPTRIGEFSPETLGGRWVEGATGPALGARFQGHVKRNGRGPMYWATATIVEYEPGRVFGTARTRTNVRGMRATLERMKAAAEAA